MQHFALVNTTIHDTNQLASMFEKYVFDIPVRLYNYIIVSFSQDLVNRSPSFHIPMTTIFSVG